MDGTVLERELTAGKTGRIRFELAAKDDDAAIRRLLRQNPMSGRIALSLEREPDFFADASRPGEMKHTIVARDGHCVVCAGSCAIRRRFVNGRARRVGYLGGLRLDASTAGRFDIVRRGYEFFHEIQAVAPADFFFTSIADGNTRARRLLERGLPGMPRYEFISEFVTVLLPAKRQPTLPDVEPNTVLTMEQIVERLNQYGCQHQFFPCWTVEEIAALQPLGLQTEDFHFIRSAGHVAASAALWDQRIFKQAVIRGYAPSLAFMRPALNLVAHITGGAKLPNVGATLSSAFVSMLAVEPENPEALLRLLTDLRDGAVQRGIELLTLGFAASDPRLECVRRHFRCHEYKSRLYVVRWPDCGGSARELDGRLFDPEVAML